MNYHYTTVLHLPFILLSDELQPSRRLAHGNHRQGMLWFSTNEVMERTALKRDVPMIRFETEFSQLAPWRSVARRVGFTSGTMRRLEMSGRKLGAIPSEWRAMTGRLALTEVATILVLRKTGWQTVDRRGLRITQSSDSQADLIGPGGLVASVMRAKATDGYFQYATNRELLNADNLFDTRSNSETPAVGVVVGKRGQNAPTRRNLARVRNAKTLPSRFQSPRGISG